MFELPSLWKEIANIIGAELAGTIYNYYQIFEIALICATAILGGLTIMVQAIRVLFCDNEEAKKKLKESKSRITHCIGYIFIGLLFAEIFWMWILPPIWHWAASANDKPDPVSLINALSLWR